MLNYIWMGLIVISIVTGMATGRMEAVSAAAVKGAADAIQLVLSIGGVMILWTGLMHVAEESGFVRLFARLARPLLALLFPDVPHGSPAQNAIAMNMGANLLGLANAATPLGLQAMGHLKKLSGGGQTASRSMSMFVVVNTASLQLIPTTVAAMRAAKGSVAPFDILPAVWITSVVALTVGVVMAKLLERVWPE